MMTRTANRMASRPAPLRVLIFSIGSLGDTLLVVPAVHALRTQYPAAELVLLSDVQASTHYVLAKEILMGTGLIDRALTYAVYKGCFGRFANLLGKLRLLIRLRRQGFDTLAYFVEAYRGSARVSRDRRFFRLAGIRRFIGMDGLEPRPMSRGLTIERVTSRADELLNRLAASGLRIPEPGGGMLDLHLQADERAAFEQWRRTIPSDGGRPWIGIGPGSKMPAKVWPGERFQAVVQRLIDEFDCWPVVFGGPEDAELGKRLTQAWGRGAVAAGALGVRAAAAGLERCQLYVGNDTGTMHLAAAAGTRCVAIFSAREPKGRWDPYGPGHQVLRTDIDCAGCQLIDCLDRAKACMMQISIDSVHQACRTLLLQLLPVRQVGQ